MHYVNVITYSYKGQSAGAMTLFLLFTSLRAENWTSAGVMTFFALHLSLGGKLDICGHRRSQKQKKGGDNFFSSNYHTAAKKVSSRPISIVYIEE